MFSYSKSMENIESRGLAKFDIKALLAQFDNGDYQTLLHIKYIRSVPCGFRDLKQIILVFFPL